MRTIRTVEELRARPSAGRVGLVPTMGAFHAGHESLIRAAREETDEVVVSLFVNPAQFNDARDLEAYPRDEQRDAAKAEELGADVLFAPGADEVYPQGFGTKVVVEGLSDVYEGAKRGPGHFAGVSTVVAKLFNMVQPDVAYFGEKDAQQVAVLRRMVKDLDFPLELRVMPTVRDPDGLALSSRNVRLSPAESATGPRPQRCLACRGSARPRGGRRGPEGSGRDPRVLRSRGSRDLRDPRRPDRHRSHHRHHPPHRQPGGDPGTPGRRPERSRQCPPRLVRPVP